MTQLHTQNPPGGSEPTVPMGRVVAWCLAILSVAAAVLHFAVASENFGAHWSFGVLMLVAAWLQVMWAVAVIVRSSRSMLWAGAVLGVGVVVAELATHPAGGAVVNGLCGARERPGLVNVEAPAACPARVPIPWLPSAAAES